MLLNKRKASTQARYRRHYNEFMDHFKYNRSEPFLDEFSQSKLDIYSMQFDGNESKSNQQQRVAALKLFLVNSQGFNNLNFKDFSKKSVR